MSGRRAVGAFAVVLAAITGAAQEPPGTPPPLPPPVPIPTPRFVEGEYQGVATCGGAKCHGGAGRSGERAVFQNEIEVWNNDPHRRAWTVLSNELSKRIGGHLELAAEPARAPECLVCHAVTKAPSGRGEIVDEPNGISCEGCHGPAGGWIDKHSQIGTKHEVSVATGLIDLRRIDVRTQTCLRCHLGAPGGEVTHDLIAAGHPELFFELDTFTDGAQMQAHWRQTEDREGRRETHGPRAWLVGQVESLRGSLLLLADREHGGRWPEFAEMSCDDCHHALSDGAWRRDRGFVDRPGVPAWNPMSWTVSRHVIKAVAPEQFDAIAADLRLVASGVAELRRPVAETVAAAERATSALSGILPRANGFGLDRTAARSLLKRIVGDPEFRRAGDRQSARQIASAVFSLTYAIYFAKQTPDSVEPWSRQLLELTAPGMDPSFDRKAFLAALDAVPAELK